MMALNFSDRDLARRVLDARCDAMSNGWIGRQLPGLLAQYGLAEIEISPTPSINLSWEATQGDLRRSAAIAAQHGAITAAEEQAFLEELAQRAATGQFFLSGVMFIVAGRKP